MRVLFSLFNLYLLKRLCSIYQQFLSFSSSVQVFYTPYTTQVYYTRYTINVFYTRILTYSFNSSNLHRTFEVEVEDQYHAEYERDEDEDEIVV